MKKPEKPYLVIDVDDAFPDFADPQWVQKMLAAGWKYAAQRPKSKTNEPETEATTPAPSGG